MKTSQKELEKIYLSIWAGTRASTSCLYSKEVIENSAYKVVMKESPAWWMDYKKREDR